MEFRRTTQSQISSTIKRAIHENFFLNNQMNYLSDQLERCIELNQKSTDENQQLTRTVSVLEDVETQSTTKLVATENVVRRAMIVVSRGFARSRSSECCAGS